MNVNVLFKKAHCIGIYSFFFHNDIKDEDVDIEEEIDLFDPVVASDEELSGNALLWSSYIINETESKEPSKLPYRYVKIPT